MCQKYNSTEIFSYMISVLAFVFPVCSGLEVRVRTQSQKTTGVDILPFGQVPNKLG